MTVAEIRAEVFSILENLNLPIYLQGSMSNDESYPETFITYIITNNSKQQYADNAAVLESFTIYVAVYSNNMATVDNISEIIKHEFKNSNYGFNYGEDAVSDEKSHTGYVQEFIKLL